MWSNINHPSQKKVVPVKKHAQPLDDQLFYGEVFPNLLAAILAGTKPNIFTISELQFRPYKI